MLFKFENWIFFVLNDDSENDCNRIVIKRILESGADINARTKWGDTPVHYAAMYSCYEVLRQLIDKGAEVHKPPECK